MPRQPDPCLEKPRKKMVPATTLDKIFRRRNLPNTQFYFTNRKHAVLDTPAAPKIKSYRVPMPQKLLSYIKWSDRNEKVILRQRAMKPLHLKDNFNIAATRDLSQRLYIKDVPDGIKTVLEIHPEFYTVIEGRPLRRFDDIKVYLTNIRGYAMARQQIGYRRDLYLKLTQDTADEIKEYNNISNNIRTHIKHFQAFLTEDYKKALAKVAKAEKVHQELQAKISEYVGFVIELTLINNVLFKLDSIRNVLKTYRTYLLFAAPLYWRQEYDETFMKLSVQFSEGEFVTHSGEFATDNDLVATLDIEKIVEEAIVELRKPYPAHMYFKLPEEMLFLFRTMELQSREYLIQLSKTQAPYKLLMHQIRKFKEATKTELDFAQYYIDKIKMETDRELYNELYLQEKFMRILNETFYDTVCSPETLKLKICVEYVYEQIFGKCDEGHQNIRDPMKILEVLYEEYNLKLDKLDFKIVTEARKDFFQQDLEMMRQAFHAERELKEFHLMTESLKKSFLPPAKFKRPQLKKFMTKGAILELQKRERRAKDLASGKRMKPKKFKITPEEREDLLLFTDWCEGMNPAPFLKDIETYIKPVYLIASQHSGLQF
ncbi:hypothetical protein NE865_02563 [Phthorimaea operculella]|nr:hypothetical protein NE865_02563 [Phthorimaea operculella]